MDFDDIRLQEQLSEKQLAIFNGEMQRQHRSTGIGYLLLIFLGVLGVHKFYLGRVFAGIVYALLFIFGWAFMGAGGAVALFGTSEEVAAGGGMAFLGSVFLVILSLGLLWDLITLPSQIRSREKRLRQELLQRLIGGAVPGASQTTVAK